MDVRFRLPAGFIVCGPTMSGKTQFVLNLLKHSKVVFDKPVDRVVYCYSEWQKCFEELPNVEFVKGVEPVLDDNFFSNKKHNLLILDDLALSVCDDVRTTKFFTQGIHHRNLSVMLILQNLYKQGKAMRDIMLNAQYLILFKNVRDVNQISVLARQTGLPHLTEAYRKVTSERYQPLVIDMRPETEDYLRIRSHVSPGELTRVYLRKNTLPPCRKESKTSRPMS
jgi:hypothetical protein